MKSMNELFGEMATILNEIVELRKKEQEANTDNPSNNLNTELLKELKGIRSKDYYSKKLDIKDIFNFCLFSWNLKIRERWNCSIISLCFSILLLVICLFPMGYHMDMILAFIGFFMSYLFSLNMISYLEIYFQFERMRDLFVQNESKYVFLYDSNVIQHLKNVCWISSINTESWIKFIYKYLPSVYFVIYFFLLRFWVFEVKLDQQYINIDTFNRILEVLGIVGLLFFLVKRYDRKSVL